MLSYSHIYLFLSNDCALLLRGLAETFPLLPPRTEYIKFYWSK